jgi:hypothetical protein
VGDEDALRVKLVTKLARKKVVGTHKKQVDTVKNWFATSDQGTVEDLILEMARDPNAPIEGYGGSRDNVRLTSMKAAKTYIRTNGGELPWGLRDE